MKRLTACVDVGGTFVDLALYESEKLMGVHKLLNDSDNPDRAVIQGIHELLCSSSFSISQLSSVIYSTTLAINAIIQRRGSKTALICTEGFRDALEVRGELPYDLYNPFSEFPEPIVRRALRLCVHERTRADGSIEHAPRQDQIAAIAQTLRVEQVEAVAVSLINSYANPENERAVSRYLAQALPDIPVSLSSDVLPEIGEYGRTSTTVMNAYLVRIVGQHLEKVHAGLTARGFTGRLNAVTSSGGLIQQDIATRFPIKLLESGPAAGSVGIAAMIPGDLVTFDMGGTTAKTSFINDGVPYRSSEYEAGRIERFRKGSGLLVKVPTIDIVEIGAGGGSIASLDRSGVLSVGPISAGSAPGPACYRLGGDLPTVTDADLILGYLNPDHFLGGKMALDLDRAKAAVRKQIGQTLGIDETEAALSIYRVVNAHMAQALSVHASERGINLHRLSMVALGGAGPVHVCAVAEAVGIAKVVVPANAGVLSAVGSRAVPNAFEAVATYRQPLSTIDIPRLNALLQELRATAALRADGGGDGGPVIRFEYEVDLRYEGQRSVLVVPFVCSEFVTDEVVERIRRGFEDAYRVRYGRIVSGVGIEAVTWRIRAVGSDDEGGLILTGASDVAASDVAAPSSRDVVFDRDGRLSARIFRRGALGPGQMIRGPAIIEDSSTTIVIPPRAHCIVGPEGDIVVDLGARIAERNNDTSGTSAEDLTSAATLGVYWGKLVSIVEEAATVLVRTAFSRIVTEARDYSCVLCDAQGNLIAQALQGLPEFVNSLAETVPHFLDVFPPESLVEGDVLISNDPLLCTSQMNDFVLVLPIWHGGRIVAYAANVSHSPDVGGRLLSTEAKEVFEEGIRIPVSKLFYAGDLNDQIIRILKANCRVPDVMIGDLMAQVAANRVTQSLLLQFLRSEGLPDMEPLTAEIRRRSEAAVRRAIRGLPEGAYAGDVTMDGLTEPLTIRCRIDVRHDPAEISVDFEGTSPQTSGSLNCYLNYIRAEAIYALLTVLQPGTHINIGSIKPFRVTAPEGCLVNATHPAAVGARSLVVQYVVAAIYNALSHVVPTRVMAEPAAPVWPILISGETARGSRFVEMIFLNGGLGARPRSDGVLLGFPSPVVSTKVEVFESEMPFIVEHSELVPESAGNGMYRGGPGQTFVIRSTSDKPIHVHLRTERLRHAPRGVHGGEDGGVGKILFNGAKLNGKEYIQMKRGDVLHLQTAGGGGYGPVSKRPDALRTIDLEDGRTVANGSSESKVDPLKDLERYAQDTTNEKRTTAEKRRTT